jgi:DNA-binding transcriptional ArsR family regulator
MSIHEQVNDCTIVNLWQDVGMSQQEARRADRPASRRASQPGKRGTAGPAAGPPPPARVVSDLAVLKALADPTRLAILNALMAIGPGGLPVRSVKELAEELAEPQTKLYRHVKQLEAAGLIEVAATRVVSGIVEQRYRASQRDLTIRAPGGLLKDPDRASDAEAAARNVLGHFSGKFFEAYRAGRISDGEFPDAESYRRPAMLLSEGRFSPERATAIRNKLGEVLADLAGPEDPDGVPVYSFIGFFSPAEEGHS